MKQHEEEYKRRFTLTVSLIIFTVLILAGTTAHAQYRVGDFTKGSITVGYDNRTCDGSLEGAIRYHSTNACIEVCDSSAWACAGGGTCDTTAIQLFDTPGSQSYAAPTGCSKAIVRLWGGGGGGGTPTPGMQGGGGGAYAEAEVSVTPGNNYTVYVGAGGAGNVAGEDSYFIDTSTVMAKGGAKDAGGGGQASASVGTIKYSGGNGGNQDDAGGGAAGSGGDGENGVLLPGHGGSGLYVGGSGGRRHFNGSFPGGGAGPSDENSTTGGNGRAIIEPRP